MKNIKVIFMTIVFLFCGFFQAFAQETTLEKEINYLLSCVEKTDCFFIRSTKVYLPEEAAEHIQKKYNYFKNRIHTAEDFIDYSATKSILTGKYYYLQCGENSQIKSSDWLYGLLKGYRESRASDSP